MEKAKKIFMKIQKINSRVIGIALLAMIFVVFLQTFCRFVIFKSLTWSEELSRYLFVVLIVLGVNIAISRHMFVRIEIIDTYLKGKAIQIVKVIRTFIMLIVNCIFVYSGYQLIIIGGYQRSPAMSIPMSILYSIIFLGFLLNVAASIFEIHDACTLETLEEKGRDK